MTQPSSIEWLSEPRTLIKHQIYKRYADCWMGKILQAFPSASIVDAFAGPGAYSDGPHGSSLVFAKAFLDHTGRDRFKPLRLICSEGHAGRREALSRRIAALPTHPNLRPDVRPSMDFATAQPAIDALAHPGGVHVPTLWVLDPFDIKSLPFDLVSRCLIRPKDEVLITWFADEIYRFCEVPSFQPALDVHFGGNHWRSALTSTTEHGRKAALMRAYQDGLETLPNVKTGEFSIASKNATARYSIMLATHSDSGLVCWNPVKWGLDPAAGRAASEKRATQESLWDERGALRTALEGRAGTAAPFGDLRTEAGRLGFLERQLRTTLDDLREDGRAVRESPLDARSPWPEDCVVRFYDPLAPEDEAERSN